jgi:NADPH:quinone reductase-like Zn-dependent oxidoreductase
MLRALGKIPRAAPAASSQPSPRRSGIGMRAARIHGYGGPEVLRIEEVPIPTPGPGQVRVRVTASGVNPLDWKVREGVLRETAPLQLPFTLGRELCGVIESIGPEASNFRCGDAVIGLTDLRCGGAFAEYVVVDERDLIAKPKGISHIEAAALPLASLTAHATLSGQHAVRAGERVLVLGGAGGVGHFAVQLAKLQGAWVAATTSRYNFDFVHSLGADLVIERHRTDLSALLAPVDRVVDTIGPTALAPIWNLLKPGARVRSTVAAPVSDSSDVGVHDAALVSTAPSSMLLAELAQLLADGKLRVEVQRVLSLSQTGDALALSQAGRIRGKIVLSIGHF